MATRLIHSVSELKTWAKNAQPGAEVAYHMSTGVGPRSVELFEAARDLAYHRHVMLFQRRAPEDRRVFEWIARRVTTKASRTLDEVSRMIDVPYRYRRIA